MISRIRPGRAAARVMALALYRPALGTQQVGPADGVTALVMLVVPPGPRAGGRRRPGCARARFPARMPFTHLAPPLRRSLVCIVVRHADLPYIRPPVRPGCQHDVPGGADLLAESGAAVRATWGIRASDGSG
jgi:hypothetical protein